MANVVVYVMTAWRNLPTKTSAIDQTNLNHIEQGIKNVTDFVNTLNAESGLYLSQTPFTAALKNKLDGIEAQANKYVLPTASNSTLGGVKVDAETITIDQNGVIHAAAATTQLSALTDVNLEDLEDGQILKYDATAGKWVNTSEAEVRTQLSLLEDVDIDDETLENGQTLRYNSTTEKWENGESGDVLSYDDTIAALGLPANAVYITRLATPVMTDYEVPYNRVVESSHYSGQIQYYGWRSFQQRNTDYTCCWVARNNNSQCWLRYEFDRFVEITKIEISVANEPEEKDEFPSKIIIQGSNDGETWTNLGEMVATTHAQDERYIVEIANPAAYKYYNFLCTEFFSSTYCTIGMINMYERVMV